MFDRYPSPSSAIIAKNRTNIKTNYPVSAVGVNTALLIADVFGLRTQKYNAEPMPYWSMFEHPSCFYEVFCICFLYMNQMWVNNKATRSDFGKIMG